MTLFDVTTQWSFAVCLKTHLFSSTSFCLAGWLFNSKDKNYLPMIMIPESLKRQLPGLWRTSIENNFHVIFLASPKRLRTDLIMYIYRKISRWFWILFVYKYVCKKQNLDLYEVFRYQNRSTKHFYSEDNPKLTTGHGGISTAWSLKQQNDVFLEICLVLTTRQEHGAI